MKPLASAVSRTKRVQRTRAGWFGFEPAAPNSPRKIGRLSCLDQACAISKSLRIAACSAGVPSQVSPSFHSFDPLTQDAFLWVK